MGLSGSLAEFTNKSPGPVTPQSWAISLLQACGLPVTTENRRAIVAWEKAEGGAGPQFHTPKNTANYNPLNTTRLAPGATVVNGAGVKSYLSWAQGLKATEETLKLSAYTAIVAALKKGNDGQGVVNAVATSEWGTGSLILSTYAANPSINSNGVTVSTSSSSTSSPGSSPSESTTSDVGELARGTSTNPDEDSYECIMRLASAVNWYAFPVGNIFYYMDGPDFARQHPVLTIDVPGNKVTNHKTGVVSEGTLLSPTTYTFDNQAAKFRRSRKLKTRVQRRAKSVTPSSPSEVRMRLICGPTDFHAGDLVEYVESGPMNGRWVITNTTRNVLKDPFTEFTLEPPSHPLPEPRGKGTSSSSSRSSSSSSSSSPGSVNPEGYTNPFARIGNLSPSRIDMGVDYGGTGPIVALGAGEVYYASSSSGWPGGAFIGIKLSEGAYAGKCIYHAENIAVQVKQGQHVKAGTVIGQMTGGTESGWASGQPQQALAEALHMYKPTGDPGGWESAAGASFNRFLVSLGCKSGVPQAGGPHGTMPAGYP